MSITRHPEDDTLLIHAAGSLHPSLALVVDMHLRMCPDCAERHAAGLALGGTILDELTSNPMPSQRMADAYANLRTRMAVSTHSSPPSPPHGASDLPRVDAALSISQFIDSIAWQRLTARVDQNVLSGNRTTEGWVRLFRFKPGTRIPRHRHDGEEFTLVLRGSYTDQTGRYGTGDFCELDESLSHSPKVGSDTPCIALTASTGGIHFDKPILRVFGRLIGI